MSIVLGIITALVVGSFIVLLALTLYAGSGRFLNQPEGLRRSDFHLFTMLEPGQVKVIERGQKLVRMITNTAHKKFARVGGNIETPEYWELVTQQGFIEDPVAKVWWPIRWWARYVYNKTGAVFIGIYPFQKIREYKLEKTLITRKERKEGDPALPPGLRGVSNVVLTVRHDLSDHFRTRQFLFPMHITAAETRDKIPLDIIGVAELEVVNPYKAAYETDRWDHAIINLVTDKISSITKQMRLDQALTAENDAEARAIAKAVMEISDDTKHCGIDITGFRILEINPILDEAGQRTIQAEAFALQNAKATTIDGKARADALRELNEANATGGDTAIATMEAEAFVRAAEAVGKNGGSAMLMPPSGRNGKVDSTQAAILAELQKINRKGRNT